ncbi:MAG: TIGR02453 family protein [Myxococcales bacterium FL481]|nr:MAG: TIGR02453 family protein [Myxococcales bacterium FL481]
MPPKTPTPAQAFRGFSPPTFEFLDDLAANNEREWFNANKARYEQDVRDVALAFVRAMGPAISALSKHFVIDDRKVGGSLMRVYRDTRFARDKTPYKTNIGIQFRHEAGKDVHAPGFYVHIDPQECFVAAGLWRPPADALAQIRQRIVEKTSAWRRVTNQPDFARHFELRGESLRRAPRGFPADHPCVDDLRRKDHIAVATVTAGALSSRKAVDTVGQRFGEAKAYMKFLTTALDLPF